MADKYYLEADGIMERIPHRSPFLFIDYVVSCEPGKSLVAVKNLTDDEPYFAGHFPQHPVMPGVLIVESMAQAACVLIWETLPPDERNFISYLAGLEKTRFRRPAVPGDRIDITVDLLVQRRNLWRFAAKSEIDGELVAEAQITQAPGIRV
ncbi:MAG: 3-hydroxyacyl-ACP dehydratase FabZ [Gammaproteobacteria bacterium]|jgi:3-hydroxyacyl-[acyl-carrier-protein] dehydratase|nr:3-hydroxyacyl-ACP dehydratase FabZ [Gammaproteobacteria bacterium]